MEELKEEDVSPTTKSRIMNKMVLSSANMSSLQVPRSALQPKLRKHTSSKTNNSISKSFIASDNLEKLQSDTPSLNLNPYANIENIFIDNVDVTDRNPPTDFNQNALSTEQDQCPSGQNDGAGPAMPLSQQSEAENCSQYSLGDTARSKNNDSKLDERTRNEPNVTDKIGNQSEYTNNEEDSKHELSMNLQDSRLNEIGPLDQFTYEEASNIQIPEAMPLISKYSLHNKAEGNLYQFRKAPNRNSANNQQDYCKHEDCVENWKCNECNSNISKFNIVFDDSGGRVNTFTEIVYENGFLSDFNQFFRQLASNAIGKEKKGYPVLIYQAYEPSNVLELKEYIFMLISKKTKAINQAAQGEKSKQSPFGSGIYQNLSGRLLKYLISHDDRQKRLKEQYGSSILLIDSIFESGNLLQAERSGQNPDHYNLFMQVDTNTRGHQQWFYFRATGGVKGKTYTFNIMNFTKPGVAGGRGYKSNEHSMRIVVKSRKKKMEQQEGEGNVFSNPWENIVNKEAQCQYIKTSVQRRKKDVVAAANDSDQEDWVEEAFNQQNVMQVNSGQAQGQMPQIAIPGKTENEKGQAVDGPQPNKEKHKKRRVFYYYSLRFTYEFEYDNDQVYFAFAQPYTYSNILNDIHQKEMQLAPKPANDVKKPILRHKSEQKFPDEKDDLTNQKQDSLHQLRQNQFQKNLVIDNQQRLIYYQRHEFCKTLSGMPLYKISIARDQRSLKKNQIVLITSRVHSGETPGSFAFKGIYDFLTSDQREAKYLRRFYTFILIPCMNPDGVICGNYRNSLAGVDLNRQWINPVQQFHPEVCAVKNLMQQIKEEDKRQIWIFCDLHGHSKKRNSFFYGCNTAANGGFLSWTIVRLLPRIFAQKTHMFNYKDCKFRVEPYKIGTARIVAWKQFQITHSFTLENSFYGYDIGEGEHQMFTLLDYQNIGMKFVLSIYEMHYMWKQIQRELQITHGWLKPRTLNQMTGVPAAQIMAEETAQAKEEERKKKAIEQYEDYLKSFYTNSKPKFQSRQKQSINAKCTNFTENNEDQAQIKLNTEKEGSSPKKDDMVFRKTRNSRMSNNQSENIKLEQINLNKTKDETEQQEQKEANGEDDQVEMEVNENEDHEFMFKMHKGLVKIQALIRGHLARAQLKKNQIKKQNKLINRQINQQRNNNLPRQRSNQLIKNSSGQKLKLGRLNAPSQQQVHNYDTSSDGAMKGTVDGTTQINNFESSNEEGLIRSNTDQIPYKNLSDSGTTTKSQDTGNVLNSINVFGHQQNPSYKPKLDWRDYFQCDELDKAYQIVEVEQRDETDNDLSDASMGSNSNPSEDNFDEEEVYRNVYRVQNPDDFLEQRKMKEKEFIAEVEMEQQTQADVINNLMPKKKENDELKENERSRLDLIPIHNLKKPPLGENTDIYYKDGTVKRKNSNNFQFQMSKDDDSMKTPISNTRNKMEEDFSAQVMAEINNQVKQDSNNNSPRNELQLANDNLFANLNTNIKRASKSQNQPRALAQPKNQHPSAMALNTKLNLAQKTFQIQHNYNRKRENINQVIKDCFITKKMATKKIPNQSASKRLTQQNNYSFQQNQQYNNRTNKRRSNVKVLNQPLDISPISANSTGNFNSTNSSQSNNKYLIQQQNKQLLEEIVNNINADQILPLQPMNGQQSMQSNMARMNEQQQKEIMNTKILLQLQQQINGMNSIQLNQYLQSILSAGPGGQQINAINNNSSQGAISSKYQSYQATLTNTSAEQEQQYYMQQFYPQQMPGQNSDREVMLANQQYGDTGLPHFDQGQQKPFPSTSMKDNSNLLQRQDKWTSDINLTNQHDGFGQEPGMKKQYRYQSSKQIIGDYQHNTPNNYFKSNANSIENNANKQLFLPASADKSIINKRATDKISYNNDLGKTMSFDNNLKYSNMPHDGRPPLPPPHQINQQPQLKETDKDINIGNTLFLKYVKKKAHQKNQLNSMMNDQIQEQMGKQQFYIQQGQKVHKIELNNMNDINNLNQLLEQQQQLAQIQGQNTSHMLRPPELQANQSTKNNQHQSILPQQEQPQLYSNKVFNFHVTQNNAKQPRINSASNNLNNHQLNQYQNQAKNNQIINEQNQKNNKQVLNQEIVNIKELIHEIQQVRHNQHKQILMQQRYKSRSKTKQR